MSASSPLPPAFPAPLGLSQVPAALVNNPLVASLLALSFDEEASLAALAERDAGDELAVFEELRRASELAVTRLVGVCGTAWSWGER